MLRDHGVWQGRSIVSRAWLDESAGTAIALEPCYGMEWWVLRDACDSNTDPPSTVGVDEGFYADGYGGQYLTVVPSTNVLAVRTTTPPGQGLPDSEYLRISFYAFPHEATTFVRPSH